MFFKVENTRFRIPRFFLTQHSTYFRELFAEEKAYSMNELEIADDDVTAQGFEVLLFLLYPP